MPHDLKESLRTFVPPPRKEAVNTVDTLPASIRLPLTPWMARDGKKPVEKSLIVCEMEYPAQRNLVAVLRLIDAGKVGINSTTKRPTLAGAKALAVHDSKAKKPCRGKAPDHPSTPNHRIPAGFTKTGFIAPPTIPASDNSSVARDI